MTNFNSIDWKNNSTNVVEPNEVETPIWDGLKQVFAVSSGFHRWQLEREMNHNNWQQNISLDQQVSLYLRETLETLAY